MNEPNDFWGDVPDWTGEVARHRRGERRRPVDGAASTRRGGALAKWWGSALSAGVEPTREHRVVDATAPRSVSLGPGDLTDPVGRSSDAERFVDITIDPVSDRRSSFDVSSVPPSDDAGWLDRVWNDTTSGDDVVGEPDPPSGHLGEVFDDTFDDEPEFVAPPRGGVDPLLARIGGVAVVLTLLVPLVVGLRSNGGDDLLAGAPAEQAVESASTPVPPSVATATVDTSTGDATTSGEATAVVDVASLPLAVPVESGAEADTAATDSAPTTADSPIAEGTATTTAAASTDESDVAADAIGDAASAPDGSASSEASASVTESTTRVTSISGPASVDGSAGRTAPNCAVQYEVRSGDYWLRLVDSADVTLADLLAANEATVDTPLYPGRIICLPAGATTPAAPTPTTEAPATTQAPATTAPATTTPTTAAPTTTAPARDTSPAGPEEIKQIIRDVWPDELEDRALEIAYRESRFDPRAKNYCCYGLFQMYWSVHRGWLADLGITSDQQLYDPRTNARAALALYQRSGGWGPWGF